MTDTSTATNGDASTCSLWLIDDGGERWWYAEPTAEAAAATHRRVSYEAAGCPWPEDPDEQPDAPVAIDAGEVIGFHDYGPPGDPHALTSKTAGEWARQHGPGFIATTAC